MSSDACAMDMIDLFSGAGGLSLGLEAAGFRAICAVERDPDASVTYAAAHPHCDLLVSPIEELNFRHLRGQVQLVAGGPPCQPFSSGGKRLGADDERDMIPEFFRAIREVQPPLFVMENVPGLLAEGQGGYLGGLLDEAEAMGYATSIEVLSAAAFGVPQKRRRLFIVGSKLGPFRFPVPTHGPGTDNPYRTAGSVVDPFNIVGEPNPAKVTYAKRPDLRPNPYDGHLFNGGGRAINPEALSPTILATAGGNKTPFLDPLGEVPRYHAELMDGKPARQGELPGARRITLEETALLQTFPLNVRFFGTRSSRYRQVGNAVPPLLARNVGEALLRLLGSESSSRQVSNEAVGQFNVALNAV